MPTESVPFEWMQCTLCDSKAGFEGSEWKYLMNYPAKESSIRRKNYCSVIEFWLEALRKIWNVILNRIWNPVWRLIKTDKQIDKLFLDLFEQVLSPNRFL